MCGVPFLGTRHRFPPATSRHLASAGFGTRTARPGTSRHRVPVVSCAGKYPTMPSSYEAEQSCRSKGKSNDELKDLLLVPLDAVIAKGSTFPCAC
jgi:hypothetical protein